MVAAVDVQSMGDRQGAQDQDRIVERPARAALGTGLLGAFTTFSTFSNETVLLVQQGKIGGAVANVALNLVLGLLGAVLGLWLAQRLLPA